MLFEKERRNNVMKKVKQGDIYVWPCCGKEWCVITDGFALEHQPLLFRLGTYIVMAAILVSVISLLVS